MIVRLQTGVGRWKGRWGGEVWVVGFFSTRGIVSCLVCVR